MDAGSPGCELLWSVLKEELVKEGFRGAGGGGLAIKQGDSCRPRGKCIVHQRGSGSQNNAYSQTGSSEEGIGGNENGRHYSVLQNC